MTSSQSTNSFTHQPRQPGDDPDADMSVNGASAVQQATLTRLPWTTGGVIDSSTAGAYAQNGDGNAYPDSYPNVQTNADQQGYSNAHDILEDIPQAGGIFSISAGPMPEEIPGFPYPEPETKFPQYAASVTRDQGSAQRLPTPDPRPLDPTSQPQNAIQQPSIRPISPLGSAPAAQPRQQVQQPWQQPMQPVQPVSAPLSTQPNLNPQQGTQPNLSLSALNALNSMAAANAAAGNGVATTGRLSPGLLFSDKLQTGYLDPMETMFAEPRTVAETGINQGLVADLVIKTMYFTSYLSGQEISALIRLPFYGVIDQVIILMKKEQLCEVSGTAGLGEAGYQYILTVKGMERAHQVLARSSYVGPCPVPLQRYIDMLHVQTSKKPVINREVVDTALRGLVISEDLKDQIGSAVNAGKSLFLFGAPGNGKTLLTEKIATMLGGYMAIPYAIEADGQIIQLFDLNSHRPFVPPGVSETDVERAELSDRRWLRVYRPVVIVGGELTMSSLDLIYNELAGFYEAPFQLKANGGLFLIDDFGRQQVSPQALLNRWIVPLEKSVDFLTLKTGKKLQVPFELFLVLSTNLQPEDLIDDAFLRRIQNKLNVPDPTAQQFYEIFVAMCKSLNVPFDQQGFTYLVTRHYMEVKRPFRASQPRDLLRQLTGIARYRNVPPEMTQQLLDAACSTYFVNAKPKAS